MIRAMDSVNTGMGTGALIRVTPSDLLGMANTAAGYEALSDTGSKEEGNRHSAKALYAIRKDPTHVLKALAA